MGGVPSGSPNLDTLSKLQYIYKVNVREYPPGILV